MNLHDSDALVGANEQHPALKFARTLDPSQDAVFNVELYTDVPKGGAKAKHDPRMFRRANLTLSDLEALIPELERRNADGAGVFISVNRCAGNRCIENVAKLRAVHADLDDATDEQRAFLLQKLPPSIVVTSSEPNRLQLYWLLESAALARRDEVGRINKILAAHYGADSAATDIARLLRAPGFRHMKYRHEDRTPTVSAEYNDRVYSLDEIQAAFPEQDVASVLPVQSPRTRAASAMTAIERDVMTTVQSRHPDLWNGKWDKAMSRALIPQPFTSQSHADLSLAANIAHELARKAMPANQLAGVTEKIFNESALADREKWQGRDDYRVRTISKAISGLGNKLAVNSGQQVEQADLRETHKDVRNASRFAARFKGKFIYVTTTKKWYRWSGYLWVICEHGEELQAAKEVCKILLDEAKELLGRGDPRGDAMGREAINAHTLPRIEAMIKLATSEPGMAVTANELDADPYLLGVRNGVIDLRTGSLLSAEPNMFITKQCNAEYAEVPPCPLWISFLHQVFQSDVETIRAVQILLGYTLIGQVLDELLIICFGFGANGKSVFNNVISSVLGDYAQTAPSSMLSVRRNDDTGPRNDLAGVKGSRYLSINELQAGDRLDEAVVKSIAGREPIAARFLYGEFFNFLPTFKAWVRTNHKPIITGDDTGIWRRIVLIPFTRTFVKDEQDPRLEQKLLQEKDGILGWILEGTREYLKTGIVISPRMQAEINSYRTDSDVLGEFLEDKTLNAPAAKVEQKQLYSAYRCWCDSNGVRPQSKKSFTQRLKERGFLESKSGSARYYGGLELIDDFLIFNRAAA